jgi:hypothetical protein
MNTESTTQPLSDWLGQAWNDHQTQPDRVAAGLAARLTSFGDDKASADAIGLAEHVFIAHLRDREGLRSLLRQIPDAARASTHCQPMIARAEWLLATLGEQPTPDIADALRWRSMQNLWSARIAEKQTQAAIEQLAHELPLALAHSDPGARRALAVACNNLAVELRTGERVDAHVDRFMLQLAEAAKALWLTVGTWVHSERADYQLARCYAALGNGAKALEHARAGLATIEAHRDAPEADACERFFAHEALAWAQLAAQKPADARSTRIEMTQLRDAIADEGLRAWCDEALVELDRELA